MSCFNIDARGVDGRHGLHGHHGYSSGSNGTHGTSGTCGEDGGTVIVTLRRGYGYGDGQLGVDVEYFVLRDRVEVKRVREVVVFGVDDRINVDVRGGRGGNGGNGGNGARGYDGRDGSDASRYSSGSNGGNGGDGGLGTHGSGGGAGGRIEFRVESANESDLFMLVGRQLLLEGGKGGRAGRHGHGGQGGRGGRGGSSYSWTDSDGKSHSNSGGSSGMSGSSGRTPTFPLRNGLDGIDGNLSFCIGGQYYESIYELECVSFNVASAQPEEDGIFEPGERLVISDIIVRNVGEMPTPPNLPFMIFVAGHNRDNVSKPPGFGPDLDFTGEHRTILENKRGAWCDPNLLGQSCVLEGTRDLVRNSPLLIPGILHGYLGDTVTERRTEARYSETRFIKLGAVIAGIPCRFNRFCDAAVHSIPVSYPMGIENGSCLRSLGLCEGSKVRFDLRHDGTIARPDRKVVLVFSGRSKLDNSSKFMAINATSLVISMVEDLASAYDVSQNPSQDMVEAFQPGEVRTWSGAVGVGPAEAFQTLHELAVEVWIERINPWRSPDMLPMVMIQHLTFNIRVSDTYRFQGASVLIVMHTNVSQRQLTAVQERLDAVGLKYDHYDCSRNGIPSFDPTVAPMCHYTTVVTFAEKSPFGATDSAPDISLLDVLNRNELLEINKNLHFIILDEAEQGSMYFENIERFQLPTTEDNRTITDAHEITPEENVAYEFGQEVSYKKLFSQLTKHGDPERQYTIVLANTPKFAKRVIVSRRFHTSMITIATNPNAIFRGLRFQQRLDANIYNKAWAAVVDNSILLDCVIEAIYHKEELCNALLETDKTETIADLYCFLHRAPGFRAAVISFFAQDRKDRKRAAKLEKHLRKSMDKKQFKEFVHQRQEYYGLCKASRDTTKRKFFWKSMETRTFTTTNDIHLDYEHKATNVNTVSHTYTNNEHKRVQLLNVTNQHLMQSLKENLLQCDKPTMLQPKPLQQDQTTIPTASIVDSEIAPSAPAIVDSETTPPKTF